jgi:hypothetical protein
MNKYSSFKTTSTHIIKKKVRKSQWHVLGLATYGKTGKVLLVCSDGGGIYLILKNGKDFCRH